MKQSLTLTCVVMTSAVLAPRVQAQVGEEAESPPQIAEKAEPPSQKVPLRHRGPPRRTPDDSLLARPRFVMGGTLRADGIEGFDNRVSTISPRAAGPPVSTISPRLRLIRVDQ